MQNKNKMFLYASGFVAVLLFLVGLDQMTKFLAVRFLKEGKDLILIPGVFSLTYLENRGAAFGMLENQQWFFVLGAAVISCLAAYVVIRVPKEKKYGWLMVDMALVMAGAFGNLIDRVALGYVIDFLYISLIDFPVFNVADIYVTTGAILFFVLYLFSPEERFAFLFNKKPE